jgi:hypothetical protein
MYNQQNIQLKFSRILLKIFPRLNKEDMQDTEILLIIRYIKFLFILLSVPLLISLCYYILFLITPFLQNSFVNVKPGFSPDSFGINPNKNPVTISYIEQNRIKRLERNYAKYSVNQAFLVINTTENKFSLNNKGKVVREGRCSTGSFILLDAGEEKKWKFETPKGLFRIHGKAESPVWNKPDWAFIEEGLPVPPSNSHLRWESGVLGDYALSIGDGYLIHGTLYKRLLGMPVTHGCVRMDDEDLEVVFNTLRVGSKVYIY